MEVKEIIELMKAVSDNGLTKFELEQGDTRLMMKREKQMVTISAPTAMPVAVSTETMETAQQVNAGQNIDSMVYTGNVVYCPLVGTFYSAPAPDAESFVNVGDRVKKGQVIGIVE
ncbi:MAG: acetyl-CoA carboxylase, biotin carboxyl carrier protein, partial [Lachnospiraceae bacterium]|nr:acetyl-CoA carboxylase, biotin carboxyl carrier protein [Lachnospiraceae bacterium]